MSDVEVKMDRAAIARLERAAAQAVHMTAESLHTEIVQAQVVPRDTGLLQNESFFVNDDESNGTATLTHSTPYARRLYFHPEYNFSKKENPNAKGEWFEDWLPGGAKQDFAQKAFGQFYKKITGV